MTLLRRYVRETYPQIERDYIQTGALRYVVRDLPLESIHKEAFKAAEATHCARDQGKYWEMHGRLFANQRQLGRDDLTQACAGARARQGRHSSSAWRAESTRTRSRKDLAEAQRLQVTGTPTFFIGVAGANGRR